MCISPKTNRSTSPRSLVSSTMGAEDNTNNNHAMQIQKQHHQGKAVVVHSASTTTAKEDPHHHQHHHHRREGHHPHNRRFIIAQHDYHDHANDCAPRMGSAALLPPRGSPTGGGTSSPAAFPVKLYDMLEKVVTDGYENVVSWQPHGRCFVVHQAKYFQQHLLPRYFGGLSKMPSFQRQLNLYGFMRISRGPDKGGYYHELFLRSKPFLMHRIQRIKVKGTGVRARSNPDQEPDFWNMPWVGEGAGTGSPSAPASSSNSKQTTQKQDQPQQPPQAAVQSSYMQQQLSSPPMCISPPSQVPSQRQDDLPNSSPWAAAKPQALFHSSRQQFLDRAVEPLNRAVEPLNRSSSKAVSPPSSGSDDDDDEAFDNYEEEDNDMIIMEGWGKPFYFLGALPKPPSVPHHHVAKENIPVQQKPTTTMSVVQVRPSPSSYRPLPPAPRMFISSKPTAATPPPPPPLAAAADVAPPRSTKSTFEFDAIDFFMDDVLNCNQHHHHDPHGHHHRTPSNYYEPQQQQGNNNSSQDAEFFAEMLERIIQ